MDNMKGFTLIELILVLFILGIISSMTISISQNYSDQLILKTTAYEIRNALNLAQQLSIDEGKRFNFEIIGRDYLVKEDLINGRVVLRKSIPKQINVTPGSNQRVSYNLDGVTSYSNFTFINQGGKRVRVSTEIGTGRVSITFLP